MSRQPVSMKHTSRCLAWCVAQLHFVRRRIEHSTNPQYTRRTAGLTMHMTDTLPVLLVRYCRLLTRAVGPQSRFTSRTSLTLWCGIPGLTSRRPWVTLGMRSTRCVHNAVQLANCIGMVCSAWRIMCQTVVVNVPLHTRVVQQHH